MRARSRVATSCSISPRSTAGVRAHSRETSRAAPIAASSCSPLGRPDRGDRLLGERVLHLESVAVPGDLLPADEQTGFQLRHAAIVLGRRRPPPREALAVSGRRWPLSAPTPPQGGEGRPGGEGNRPPYPPAYAEAETRRRRGILIMWAGAGVGGLRTPARCLDSRTAYPYRNACKRSFPKRPLSAVFCRHGPLQLTLVHAGAALDVQALRPVVELLLRLTLRPVRPGPLPAALLGRCPAN